MISPEGIAQRFDNKVGYAIVDSREIGLPTFLLNTLLTLQAEQDVGPIEEFLLKCVHTDVADIVSISDFLGLPLTVVSKQVGAFVYDGVLAGGGGSGGKFVLTGKGRERFQTNMKGEISRDQIPIYVDGITRRVVALERRNLYNAAELEDLGIACITPTPHRPPRGSEIDVAAINRVFDLVAGHRGAQKRALRLDAVVGRTRLYYRRAVALAYKSENGRSIALSFAIDGRLSEDHEIAFARSPHAAKSKLLGPLFDANKRRREVQDVLRHVKERLPSVHDALAKDVRAERPLIRLAGTQRALDDAEKPSLVRPLRVYEHPPLLERAFEEASNRILIISPWIRAEVVNSVFVERLAKCLGRGVHVTIAYGLGRVDKGERPKDRAARSALEGLSQSFTNFTFIRKGNTHAKVLLVDDAFCVTTSFNWLSFRGDSQQPFREEWGTYVEGTAVVNKYHDELENYSRE